MRFDYHGRRDERQTRSADRQGTGDASEIMAMKHRDHPTYGVQFHPESIGTEHGKRLLENFLRVVRSPSTLT